MGRDEKIVIEIAIAAIVVFYIVPLVFGVAAVNVLTNQPQTQGSQDQQNTITTTSDLLGL
jgi:hypothetical protein